MSNFKPVLYTNNHLTKADVKIYPTYAELKRNIKRHLKDSLTGQIEVYRSRRGQWGEWFEHWILVNGKPTIKRQGWQ